MLRLNVGCGQTPTPGWKNYDNSWSIRLSNRPVIVFLLTITGFLNRSQREFISAAKRLDITWADVVKRIPERDRSVHVLYSSHMLEHLDRQQALRFLGEAFRVLVPGGIVRISVPNIRSQVDAYLQDNDADRFIAGTLLTCDSRVSLKDKIRYIIVGARHHQWMYDGTSLCKLLEKAGFERSKIMAPGTTMIPDSGQLNLREREAESVVAEAVKP